MSNQQPYSVAIITSTIGRKELERAIISIQEQTYSCNHYVFVDGKEYWENISHLETKYPNVNFIKLPSNTGKDGVYGGAVFASAPYLLKEDVLFYLDDDNWYEKDHIETMISLMYKHNLDYVYSLRNLYTDNNKFLFKDNILSLGFWKISPPFQAKINFYERELTILLKERYLVDTNCYAIKRQVAFNVSSEWIIKDCHDEKVFYKLLELQYRGGTTGKATVNYIFKPYIPDIIGLDKIDEFKELSYQAYKFLNKESLRSLKQDWEIPTLFIDGELCSVPD